MTSYIYEPPYLPVISVVYKVVGVIGTVVNMGGIFVSLLSDTKKMNAFSRFILNVQVKFFPERCLRNPHRFFRCAIPFR